ncbi:MAG: RecQ family ATP-dependent DNA helicase [Elainellaceae cyanobacterium]
MLEPSLGESGMQCGYKPAWEHVRSCFRQIWGYDDFRPPQGEIVQCLLSHQDALIVMPTGGGKSICFQLPALMRTGLTLVISPLVALMEDQVQDLQARHLPAAALHSELSSYHRHQILRDLERQHLRLLYVSPETLLNPMVWERLCHPHLKINGLILDEAHCLIQWGDTFRPAYRRLGAVRSALLKTKPPGTQMAIAAFTATADPTAQRIIQDVLRLQNPRTFLLSPYRPNLHLSVQIAWTPRSRRQKLLRFIESHPDTSGLIYTRTRRDSEELANWLESSGYHTAAYHAGLSPSERRRIESTWISGGLPFVICTSAFGMGINKPNVRWVVHFHAPSLLSEYLQEIGRGGRDGKPSDALTLISEPTGWLDPSDNQRRKFFEHTIQAQIQQAQRMIRQIPPRGDATAVARDIKDGAIALSLLHSMGRLEWQDPFTYTIDAAKPANSVNILSGAQQMQRYLNTRQCRWTVLLESFGFHDEAAGMKCGHCDRCQVAKQNT